MDLSDWLRTAGSSATALALAANILVLIIQWRRLRWARRELDRQREATEQTRALLIILAHLVMDSWIAHHKKIPIWQAWAAAMGPINVSVGPLDDEEGEDEEEEEKAS